MFVWKDENKWKRGMGWPIWKNLFKQYFNKFSPFIGRLSTNGQLWMAQYYPTYITIEKVSRSDVSFL